MFEITPLVRANRAIIQKKIDQKIKPLGALGEIENIAMQLALVTGPEAIEISNPCMLIFAGDHGVAKENISIASSEVTQQMVMSFLEGGAAINCFCQSNDMTLEIIDAGILLPINDKGLTMQSLGRGTANFVTLPAMNLDSVNKGINLGAKVVYRRTSEGANVFGFGEMGIGNTTAAAALMSALTGIAAEECVGYGTGIDQPQYEKKLHLVKKALQKHANEFDKVKTTLAAVGGFEIVQMVGGMLAAAECNCILLIDGFISSVAALAAIKLDPTVKEYMVFSHLSGELGHRRLLEFLQVKPLLELDLRLGEGTGAALAMPMLRAAQTFYNDMASFEDAGVNPV